MVKPNMEDAQWRAIDDIKTKMDAVSHKQAKNEALITMLQENYKESMRTLMKEIISIKGTVTELKEISDRRQGSASTSKYIIGLLLALAGVIGGWIQSIL